MTPPIEVATHLKEIIDVTGALCLEGCTGRTDECAYHFVVLDDIHALLEEVLTEIAQTHGNGTHESTKLVENIDPTEVHENLQKELLVSAHLHGCLGLREDVFGSEYDIGSFTPPSLDPSSFCEYPGLDINW
jgi:hypothetical protein